MANKPKLKTHHTPKGIAVYPWLTTPDTKFNADGEYRIKLKLPEKDAQPIIDLIDAAIEEKMPEAIEELKSNPKMVEAYRKSGKLIETKGAKGKPGTITGIVESRPYSKVFNDQNEETGEVEFTFKMKAIVKPKGKESFTQKPKLFDAAGKPIVTKVSIHGGSTVKVAYQIVPFSTAIAGCGVSLRLQAVMVVTLVSGGGRAEDYGFEAEEDGYEAPDADSFPTDEPAADAATTDASDKKDESSDF